MPSGAQVHSFPMSNASHNGANAGRQEGGSQQITLTPVIHWPDDEGRGAILRNSSTSTVALF